MMIDNVSFNDAGWKPRKPSYSIREHGDSGLLAESGGDGKEQNWE